MPKVSKLHRFCKQLTFAYAILLGKTDGALHVPKDALVLCVRCMTVHEPAGKICRSGRGDKSAEFLG